MPATQLTPSSTIQLSSKFSLTWAVQRIIISFAPKNKYTLLCKTLETADSLGCLIINAFFKPKEHKTEYVIIKLVHLLWSRISNKLWAVQHSWESCISRSVGHFHVFTVARLINCSVTNRAIKPANKSKSCQWSAAHLSTTLAPLSFLFSRREGLSKQPGRPM